MKAAKIVSSLNFVPHDFWTILYYKRDHTKNKEKIHILFKLLLTF